MGDGSGTGSGIGDGYCNDGGKPGCDGSSNHDGDLGVLDPGRGMRLRIWLPGIVDGWGTGAGMGGKPGLLSPSDGYRNDGGNKPGCDGSSNHEGNLGVLDPGSGRSGKGLAQSLLLQAGSGSIPSRITFGQSLDLSVGFPTISSFP